MASYCYPIQEVLSVYDLGFEANSYVAKILNPALENTLHAGNFSSFTEGVDYVFVHPSTLVEDDLILGAEGDGSTIVNFCNDDVTTSNWVYKFFTVKEVSCLYSNKAIVVNGEYTFIPTQDVFVDATTEYKWKKAYEITLNDKLLDINGSAVNVTTTQFDICTDRLYWNIQVKERTSKRIALYNGISDLVVASVDNYIQHYVPPTPTPTPTPSLTAAATATPTPTPTLTPTISNSIPFTPTPSISVSVSKTAGVSSTPTLTPTATPTVTPTQSPTPIVGNGCFSYEVYNNLNITQTYSYTDCSGVIQEASINSFQTAQFCSNESNLEGNSGGGLVFTFLGICGDANTANLSVAKDVSGDDVMVYINGVAYHCPSGNDSCSFDGVLQKNTAYSVEVVVTPWNRSDAPISIIDGNSNVVQSCAACQALNADGVNTNIGGIYIEVGI